MNIFDSDMGHGLDGGRGGTSIDHFSGADGTDITLHTSDTGDTWAYHASYGTSAFQLQSNELRAAANGNNVAFMTTPMASADYDVTVDVDAIGSHTSQSAGVAGRIDTATDSMLRAYYDGSDAWYLDKVVSGVYTNLGSSIVNVLIGNPRTLTLHMVGTQISVIVDGTIIIGPYTVSNTILQAAGHAGVFGYKSSLVRGFSLDNFIASQSGRSFEIISTIIADLDTGHGLDAGYLVAQFFQPDLGMGLSLSSLGVSVYSGDRGIGLNSNSSAFAGSTTTPFASDLATGIEGTWIAVGIFSGEIGVGLNLAAAVINIFSGDLNQGLFGVFELTAASTTPWSWELGQGIEGAWVYYSPFDGDVGKGLYGEYLLSVTLVFSGDMGHGLSAEFTANQVFTADHGTGLDYAFTSAKVFSSDLGHGLYLTKGGVKTLRYHVYANAGDAGPINLSTPVYDTAGLSWTTTLYRTGVWRFLVRAYDTATMLEESNGDSITVAIRSDWVDVTNMPAAPTGLSVVAIKGGVLRVVWAYRSTSVGSRPLGFRIYKGTGGTPNYVTPAASAAYLGDVGHYQIDLAGLTSGTAYTIGVRAWNQTAEEQNLRTVTATADSTPPSAADAIDGHATAESP